SESEMRTETTRGRRERALVVARKFHRATAAACTDAQPSLVRHEGIRLRHQCLRLRALHRRPVWIAEKNKPAAFFRAAGGAQQFPQLSAFHISSGSMRRTSSARKKGAAAGPSKRASANSGHTPKPNARGSPVHAKAACKAVCAPIT